MPDEIRELIESINGLKSLLGDEGEYSICHSDRTPMGMGDGFVVGSVFERIDKAITAIEQSSIEEATTNA